jgi:Tfp pilus assembly protein PilE
VITINKHLNAAGPALAWGLALATLASPSFAQRSEQPVSAARESALRECNGAAEKYHNNHWGTTQLQMYRSCMAQHGEQE